MLIEKRFFDIAKREDEEIKRELEAEKAKMTEEEKLEEKKRHEAEVKELIRKAEARMKKHKKIPDSKKIVEFTFLQEAALEIAEHMGMNIKTERKKDDLWGTIEFAFEKMWFLDSTPSEWVDVWNTLMEEAYSVYIEIKDNMIVYQYSYDLWDMRKLDIVPRSNPIRGRYRLDFREIRQKEFKEIIKRILYSHCQTKAMGSIKGELRGFRRFAGFMYDRFPEVRHFTEISRDMIEDYLVYIKTDTGLTSVSYTTELSVLDNLLDEIGRELEIENLCNLFLSSDCRAYDNALPEAYSDAEIRRFNSALTKLKPQLGRCLIIHQMLGTRIEDTLTLRRDCLSEKSGHYFITIVQQKTRKYKRPVSDQLAELIRKAIEVSENEHPDSAYIFLQDNGNLYTDSMLKYHVNIMIYENDIRDDNGNYFEFRTHRFRHTFGVKLTEMKLDDDSIARLLGHKDTRTIPHYRRLRNEALAEDTKAVRDEMNELLAQYRREKENAETR